MRCSAGSSRSWGSRSSRDDERFATAVARSANHEALDDIIARWTTQHSLAYLERELARVNVPAMRIYTIADIFGDPHYKARQSIVAAPDPDLGTVAMAAVVPRLSDTPGGIRHSGRHVGQDTRRVLADLLGLDDAQLDALAADGVIRSDAPEPEGAETSAD